MRHYIITILAIFLGLLSLSIVFSEPSRFEGQIVKKIEFIGLKNTSASELLYMMITTDGNPLRASDIKRDLRTIFEKAKLEKLEVEVENFEGGVRLRFICVERALVDSIVFRGTSEFGSEDLEGTILLKRGDVFRIDLIERSIKLLREKYEEKGLFNAVVSYRVRAIPNSKDVIIDIIVDEGEEIKVARVNIWGAQKIYYKELMGLMETKAKGMLNTGTFEKIKYEKDKGTILGFYRQRGYLDAQIIYDRVEYEWKDKSQKERVLFITIALSEGERYYFDEYSVEIRGEEGKTVFT